MDFKTHSLKDERVLHILQAAFDAVEPGGVVKYFLHEHPLPATKRTFVFGLGKAACAMANGLSELPNLTRTLIITKHASRLDLGPAAIIEGDHPVPGKNSLAAGRAALDFVSHLTPDDLLLCLISGGGSALMTAPVIPLAELQALTSQLLANGSRIDQINTVRRHLDLLKGGGLAKAANGAKIISLILSDVVNDSLETIASGPTAPDPTKIEDAIHVAGEILPFRETLKPDAPIFANVQNHIIASNDIALNAAKRKAEMEGFSTDVLYSGLQGEAREIGLHLAEKLKEADKKYTRPFCLLAGGEMTVTIKGNGKGGRNQELVLGAVEELRGMKDVLFISIATDGEDGPTDAAGAVATGESAQRAEKLGMSAASHQLRNDAYGFFDPLGDLIKSGPSGTNVNDLMMLFAL